MRSVLILLLIVTPASLFGQQVWQVNGAAAGDRFGSSMDDCGDVNLDGFVDIVVGSSTIAQAFVLSGIDGSTLWTFSGGAGFGYDVAGAGDVDGDTIPDIVVGTYDIFAQAGQAEVFSGLTGLSLYVFAYGGFAVGGAGDVNIDGYADVSVGDPNGNTATVFSGFDGSIIWTFTAGGQFGYSVPGVGDVNVDGVPDVAVGGRYGGPTSSGHVIVYSGLDASVIYTFNGTGGGNTYFGADCEAAGDVNADGVPDIIVGAAGYPSASYQGQVNVFSGFDGSNLYQITGQAANEWLGQRVTGAGDVDGDGYDDFLAGAPEIFTTNTGRAHVYSGLNGSVITTLVGAAPSDRFGYAVAPGSDISGDGLPDIYVAAQRADIGGVDAGQVTAYSPVRAFITASAAPVIGTTIALNLNSPYTPSAGYLWGISGGSLPGIVISATQIVPLNQDPLFVLSQGPNPFFSNTSGTLSATGTGAVTAVIPNVPTLVGTTVWSAFISVDLTGPFGLVGAISGALPLTIQ